jgi:hypothetical protein
VTAGDLDVTCRLFLPPFIDFSGLGLPRPGGAD